MGKWHQYLLGRRFNIKTDHRSLKEILKQVIHMPEQQRYIRKLIGYDFVIEYKIGKSNVVADALSRVSEVEVADGETSEVWVVTCGPVPEFLSILRKENAEAQDLKGIRQQYDKGELSEDYKLVDGIITFKGRYYLSEKSELKELLLKEFHCSVFAGHGGIKKTLVGLSSMFYWPKIRRDVEKFIRGCSVCQQVKYMTTAPAGLLQPLPIPALVWNELTMNFITHLPLFEGVQ